MSALPHERPLTPEEYLEFERRSDTKHEYLDGEIFAMVGATLRHNRITRNTLITLTNQLREQPCEAFGSDLRVKISSRMYTYPDVSVVCGDIQLEDAAQDTLLNPTLIVEVLSPSTEKYDRGLKFTRYRAVESLQEYVLIAQDTPRIERYRRPTNGDEWLFTDAIGLDAALELPSIGCTLALAAVYEKVTFEEDTP